MPRRHPVGRVLWGHHHEAHEEHQFTLFSEGRAARATSAAESMPAALGCRASDRERVRHDSGRTVGVVTRRRPQRAAQRPRELDDHRPGVAHMPVAEPCGGHRQVLGMLRAPQRPRRTDVADRGKTQRRVGSLRERIRPLNRPTVRNSDHSSFQLSLPGNRLLPGEGPQAERAAENEPQSIEIEVTRTADQIVLQEFSSPC